MEAGKEENRKEKKSEKVKETEGGKERRQR